MVDVAWWPDIWLVFGRKQALMLVLRVSNSTFNSRKPSSSVPPRNATLVRRQSELLLWNKTFTRVHCGRCVAFNFLFFAKLFSSNSLLDFPKGNTLYFSRLCHCHYHNSLFLPIHPHHFLKRLELGRRLSGWTARNEGGLFASSKSYGNLRPPQILAEAYQLRRFCAA